MNRIIFPLAAVLFFVLAGNKAHAAVCATLPPSPSQAQTQDTLNNCGQGNFVQGQAGTTALNSTLTIPCGVQLVGPTVPNGAPATMIFTDPNVEQYEFAIRSACTAPSGTGAQYIGTSGGLGLYVAPQNISNIVWRHNTGANIVTVNNGSEDGYINFDPGYAGNTTITGADIEYNQIGDVNSCVATEQGEQYGGEDGCGIEIFSQTNNPSHMVNLVIKYNVFFHTNEAIHFYGSNWNPGVPANTCDNCDIEYNVFHQNHRITLEFQADIINHPLIISNNVFFDPLYGYFNTYLVSTPCCMWGNILATPSNVTPAYYFQNNIEYTNTGQAEWGVEYWGNGSVATNNLIQGNICAAFQPGHSLNNMTIAYNTMQGPIMAGGQCTDYPGAGAFIEPPENAANAVGTIAHNVTGAVPQSVPSIAPTILPASGPQTFPLVVTLTDPGYTDPTIPVPQGNTGIWYTTDGTTPVPGQGTAQRLDSGASFTLYAPATVQAVGMWGSWNQPASYPLGYGFTPSAVVQALYTGSGPFPVGPVAPPVTPVTPVTPVVPVTPVAPTLKSAVLTAPNSQNTAVVGGTIQFSSIGTYSDGSTATISNSLITWTTSNPSVMTISSTGLATMVGPGTANAQAVFLIGQPSRWVSSPWTVTVTAAPLPPAPTLVSAYLIATGNASTMIQGRTLQFAAYGSYSDGVIRPIPNSKIDWGSTNVSVLAVSPKGRATAVAAGSASVTAAIGTVQAVGTAITVAANTGQPFTITESLVPGVYTVTVAPNGTATVKPQN